MAKKATKTKAKKKTTSTAKKKTAAKKKTTAKSKAKKKTTSRKTKEMLLVGSKVKAFLKKNKCNTGGDALEGLNTVLYWYVEQAAKRAQSNGRKTVRAHDFMAM